MMIGISYEFKGLAGNMIYLENEKWSLGEDRYHLMLARGKAEGGKIQHHEVKVGLTQCLILTD